MSADLFLCECFTISSKRWNIGRRENSPISLGISVHLFDIHAILKMHTWSCTQSTPIQLFKARIFGTIKNDLMIGCRDTGLILEPMVFVSFKYQNSDVDRRDAPRRDQKLNDKPHCKRCHFEQSFEMPQRWWELKTFSVHFALSCYPFYILCRSWNAVF